MVQQARVDQHTLYFTPTLVIGLGGTGQRVVRRLKQKVASTFGVTSAEDYPLIRFLVIDTDNSDDPANEVSLSDRERVILHGYNPAQQLRDIDMPGREPLKRRLPVSISRSQQVIELMNMHVTHGARQNRLVSLIGLFAQFEKVRAEMVGAIDSVLSMARGINVGNVYLNGFQARSIPPTEGGFPFRVIIICSLGGGTGSGLFLDIAYLCKHFLRNQLPQMHGVLVLPPVLDLAVERTSWTQRQRIRANTYAALKEIDMLGDRGRWTYDYPLGISVDESGGPVDYCYLVERANEHGQGFKQSESVWENVSQSLLDIVTPTISNYLGTFYGNTEILTRYYPGHGTAQNRDPRDRRQGYSSFISGSIALPLQQMEDFCGATLALEAFERAAAGGDDLQEQVERTAGFLRATVNPTVLLPELLAGQAPRVGAIVVGDDVGTALAQFTAQTNQDRQLLQRVGAVIQEKKTALARTAKAALEQYARGVLAQHGPGSAVRALDLLSGAEAIPNASAQQQRCSLRQFAEYLANSAAAAIAEANKSLAGQQAALTELGGQGMMAMFNRVRAQESGRRAAITSAVAARDRWLAAELEGRARTALAEVAAQLGADARTLRADMEIAARGLSRSQGQLHADLRALAKGDAIPGSYNMDADYEMGISVVEIPMMSRIYEELTTEDDRRQAIDSLRERLAGRPLEHFKSLATGESEARDLATQFRKDCALFFRDRLRNQDVLDYLTRSHPDRNPQQVVGEAIMDIRQRALPLWRYDKNRLGGELEHLAIIGVADATDPRVPAWMHDQGESFQVRSTNVRWRIDLLHIRHGVPIGLLANAAEWRQSYDETSGGALPTHIIDHANLQDIIPPSVAPRIFGGEQMFVVGMALTWIGKVGASYYLDVAGDIKNKIAPPPERLIADGRVGAMETFSRNSTWVAEGAALTQRLLRQFGQAKIFEQLEAYFQDLTDELRRATPGGDQAAQCRKELDLLRQYIEAQRG